MYVGGGGHTCILSASHGWLGVIRLANNIVRLVSQNLLRTCVLMLRPLPDTALTSHVNL